MAYKGIEKAAIFLSAIGEEAASEVLRELDIKYINKISSYMSQIKMLERDAVDNIFKEVKQRISRGDIYIAGTEYLRNVLSRSLGDDDANRILEMTSKGTIEILGRVDSKTLTNFLITEHPQTIAFVLCLLEPSQASEILSAIPEDLRIDVAMRIATIDRIPSNAIEELEDVLNTHLDVKNIKGRKLGGVKTIAEVLNYCDRTIEKTILERIEERNSQIADSIRQLMFVFEDIINIDDRGIQLLLKEVSTDELSLALKTASDALKEKIFKNMSQRAVQVLKEEMETKGPVKVSSVEKAQQNIVKIVRKLEEEGKITIGGRGEDVVI